MIAAVSALPYLLGWALLLSLPITAALAAGLESLLSLRPACTSQTKYRMAVLVFVVAALLPLVIATALLVVATSVELPDQVILPIATGTPTSTAAASASTQHFSDSLSNGSINVVSEHANADGWLVARVNQVVPLLFWLWLVLAAGRLMLLSWDKRRLRIRINSYAAPVAEEIQQQVALFAQRMGIRKPVTALACELNSVPAVFGWRRPVILLSQWARSLPRETLIPVVVHELAHVRRNDLLAITLQTGVRVAFTLDPAIYWLSCRLNRLREECCDDMAGSIWGDTRQYASALAAFALPTNGQPLAIAVNHGSLEHRITRLLKPREAGRVRYPQLVMGLMVCAIASLLGWAGFGTIEAAGMELRNLRIDIGDASFTEMNQKSPRVDRRAIRWTEFTNETSEPIPLSVGQRGYVAVGLCLRDSRTLMVRPERLGPLAIQVRSIDNRPLFVRSNWNTMKGGQGDTDAGSGRGGACIQMVECDNLTAGVRCQLTNPSTDPHQVMVTAWQPTTDADRDADVVGQASSLILLDDYGRGQVPARPNERAPAIDYPGDIDTFQIWPYPKWRGTLTISIDGFRGEIRPFCYVYDNDGRLVDSGPHRDTGTLYRFSLMHNVSGYYLAIMDRDQTATGEYMLVAHFDAD